MHACFRTLVAAGLLSFTAASAQTGVPSPATSSAPGCLTYCPQGDIVMTVIVRDLAGNPVVNSFVRIDFSNCPGIKVCPPDGTEHYGIEPGPAFTERSGPGGLATFPIRAGGVCQGNPQITADAVVLRQYMGAASPDQDGSLVVDNADEVILQSKVGTTDVTGDLDCDAAVTTTDQAVLRSHVGHACPGVVPVAPRSWGALKLIYR